MRTILALSLIACGSPATAPVANPARPGAGADCSSPPEGRRSLVARIDVERGAGAIEIDGTRQAGCAVWDLPPGAHRVRVTAAGATGFGVRARMQVADPPTRYDLFDLSCGLPGSCDTDTLRRWEAQVVADRTQMTDPCSAAKLTGIKWESEQLDAVHPKSLALSFDLHVYPQPSGKPPRDPSCPAK